MRVLSKVSHDDHDLGSEYELEGELLERLLAAGVVVPAAEWTYRYHAPQDGTGDQRHIFTQVAPAPSVPAAESVVGSIPPAPVAPVAPDVEVR